MRRGDGVATIAEQAGSDGVSAFGEYLRTQRQLARLSLRQLATLTKVSNPYLSQIERGLHQPSISVVKSLASALNVSADVLLAHAAGIDPDDTSGDVGGTEAAIREDSRLTASQKESLLAVYRSFVEPEPRAADETASASVQSAPPVEASKAAKSSRSTKPTKAAKKRTSSS